MTNERTSQSMARLLINVHIVAGFLLAGLLIGIVCAIWAFAVPAWSSAAQDLAVILCPPSLGSMVIHSRGEGVLIWLQIIAENTALYTLAGFIVSWCVAFLKRAMSSP